jgi:membrane protein YqaA with SNARE-associated domain
MPLLAIVLLVSKKSALRWLIHFGGPSLILLGLADNSLLLMPGSTDTATVLLAAHHRNLWIYYAMMATAGAVLGGYLTYRMARKSGKATVEKRFSQKTIKKIYGIFERLGFAAVAIPALLPPPFPIVPMLLAAGAMQYPTKKFVTALAVGRGIRFSILGYLGAHYGRHIMNFFSRYYGHVLFVLIGFTVLGGAFALIRYMRERRRVRDRAPNQRPAPPARAA